MKRGKLTQISMRTMLITWGVMEVLLPGVVAKGQSGTSFLVEAYQRQQQAESCSVYRSLQRRTESELVSNQSVLSLQDELIKKRREQLESCGTERGAVSFVSDDDEQLLAELCSSQYAKWLHLGFQRSLVKADIVEAKSSLEMLNSRLMMGCPEIPVRFKRIPSQVMEASATDVSILLSK